MTIYELGPYAFPVAVTLLIFVAWFLDLIWASVVRNARAWARIARRLRS